ncbi:MAG: hypothetical protein V1692_01945 [bacterium]
MKKALFTILLVVPLLTLTACSIKLGSKAAPGGGVYKSANQGKDWQIKVAVPNPGNKDLTIISANIVTMAIDPSDNKAIYLGTLEDGLIYSYNGGDGWQSVGQLNKGKVGSIVIDPKDKCTIYAATGNRIVKSTDCNRTWQDAYFETRVQQDITALAIDTYNSQIIYAGTSTGDLLKSLDAGQSWTIAKRFSSLVSQVVVSHNDTRIIYVGTKDKGIFKSLNGGVTWQELVESLKSFPGGKEVAGLVQDLTQKDVLIANTTYGLLKSTDGGQVWQALALLTPPRGATIYSLAIDPQNGNHIYYGTATTFYHSSDGGQNWVTQKLPTDKAASALLVDTKDSNVIYLGTLKLK